jgi:tetratricopeptide (TPR) repeat protein
MSEDLGYQDIPEADRKKAEAFFKQGRTVAAAGQFEYAIEMYLSGLKIDPEAVAEHQALREISLKRKASGGKDLGMMAKMKYRYGKDDRENMITAERFLAYDPGNTSRMLELIQHAVKSGAFDTVMWAGPILLRGNADSGKPDINKYLALKDAYVRLKKWQRATEAAQMALQMRPADMDLQREVKDLSARQTMDEGGYEKGGSFRDSVRDMDTQRKLMTEDTDVRTLDVLTQQIMNAREEVKKDPNEPGKITKLVDVLTKTEDMEYENEAIQVLDEAYSRTNAFRFRLRIGQIKMAQMKRTQRWLLDQYRKNPNDAEAKKAYLDFVREKTEEELKEYTLAAENYPTDITLKYEMATRLFELERFGEAIPLLQHAVQDPKIRVEATVSLGRAFLAAEFVDEAVDTLKGLTETYQLTGDARAKEIWYWYGRTLETRGDKPDAIKAYSKVAMWDFNYRDVQQRLKKLRTKPADE